MNKLKLVQLNRLLQRRSGVSNTMFSIRFCVHHADSDSIVNGINLYSVIFYSTRWKKFCSISCDIHNVQTSCRCENLKFVLVINVNSSFIQIKLHDEISTENLTINIFVIFVTFIYFALIIRSANLITCPNHAYEILTSKFSMLLIISLHSIDH